MITGTSTSPCVTGTSEQKTSLQKRVKKGGEGLGVPRRALVTLYYPVGKRIFRGAFGGGRLYGRSLTR